MSVVDLSSILLQKKKKLPEQFPVFFNNIQTASDTERLLGVTVAQQQRDTESNVLTQEETGGNNKEVRRWIAR